MTTLPLTYRPHRVRLNTEVLYTAPTLRAALTYVIDHDLIGRVLIEPTSKLTLKVWLN